MTRLTGRELGKRLEQIDREYISTKRKNNKNPERKMAVVIEVGIS